MPTFAPFQINGQIHALGDYNGEVRMIIHPEPVHADFHPNDLVILASAEAVRSSGFSVRGPVSITVLPLAKAETTEPAIAEPAPKPIAFDALADKLREADATLADAIKALAERSKSERDPSVISQYASTARDLRSAMFEICR